MTSRSWTSALACAAIAGAAFGCLATARSAPAEVAPAPVQEVVNGSQDAVPIEDVPVLAEDPPATPTVGDPGMLAASILALPEAEVTDGVLTQLEAALAELPRGELEALEASAERLARGGRPGAVYAELAHVHWLLDETEEARRYATLAGRAGARGRAEELAGAILAGGAAERMQEAPVIGLLLPQGGSPSNREYARLFMEGVEVAAELAGDAGRRFQLLVEDNRGTSAGSERGAAALVAGGASAILGPLTAENMAAAARATPARVALLSPTARRVPFGRRGVFSMGAGDPGAGRALAGAAHAAGYRTAVVVHPRSPGETLEAGAFRDAFTAMGGVVTRRLQYEPGTTTFDIELREVEAIVPPLLVVAAPASDVEMLAPQIAFFGLDTLEIQVAGTQAWTTPAVLESVARRHTDSVIAVSSSDPLAAYDRAAAFVQAYERHFRRTLTSPIPAAGFDLFRMALAAHGDGVRTSRGTVASLDRLDRFRGATGTYSQVEGRIEREFFPVTILAGRLLPFDATRAAPADTIGRHFAPGRQRPR